MVVGSLKWTMKTAILVTIKDNAMGGIAGYNPLCRNMLAPFRKVKNSFFRGFLAMIVPANRILASSLEDSVPRWRILGPPGSYFKLK